MQHCLFQQVMQYKQYFTSAGCCNIAWYRSLISKLRERKGDRKKIILKQNVHYVRNTIQAN